MVDVPSWASLFATPMDDRLARTGVVCGTAAVELARDLAHHGCSKGMATRAILAPSDVLGLAPGLVGVRAPNAGRDLRRASKATVGRA